MMMRFAVALTSFLSLLTRSQGQSIVDAVVATEDLALLEVAVTTADLVPALSVDGPLTVFAPTNSSFEALGSDLLTKLLSPEWKEHLVDVLTYHVVAGNFSSTDLTDGQAVTMLNGEIVTIGIDGEDVSVTDALGDDAMVEIPNVYLDNGVVHFVDAVLKPSFLGTTIADAAGNTDFLSTLFQLVVGAELDAALADVNATLTVFAPTNDAFDAIDLTGLTANETQAILLYHVVGSVIPAGLIADGASSVPTLEGTELSVFKNATSGSVTINGVASVTTPNVLASNGIVHVIDTVLTFPPTSAPTGAPTPAPTPVYVPSIVEAVVETEAFSTLETAVIAADLVDALSADGPFTVFAPTNASFDALPPGILTKLLSPGFETHLANVLLYHVAEGNVSSTDLFDGMEIPMLNEETVTVAFGENGVVTVQGVPVIGDLLDIFLSNGVVHGISGVLLPEFAGMTIATIALDGARTLAELIVVAGLEGSVNTTEGAFTVFAPTDEAFDMLPNGTIDMLKSPMGKAQLVGILTYHVVPGVYVSSAIPEGDTMVPTLANKGLTVTKTIDGNMTTVTVNGANVVMADLLAINGVVHVIDQVLIPPPPTEAPTGAPTPMPTSAPTPGPTPTPEDRTATTPPTETPDSGAGALSLALTAAIAGLLVPFVLL